MLWVPRFCLVSLSADRSCIWRLYIWSISPLKDACRLVAQFFFQSIYISFPRTLGPWPCHTFFGGVVKHFILSKYLRGCIFSKSESSRRIRQIYKFHFILIFTKVYCFASNWPIVYSFLHFHRMYCISIFLSYQSRSLFLDISIYFSLLWRTRIDDKKPFENSSSFIFVKWNIILVLPNKGSFQNCILMSCFGSYFSDLFRIEILFYIIEMLNRFEEGL